MFPPQVRCRLMKLHCARSFARRCKSWPEKSASATCGITHSSTRLPISLKILFREPGCELEETATKCAGKRVTTSRQKFLVPHKEPPLLKLGRPRRRSPLAAVAFAKAAVTCQLSLSEHTMTQCSVRPAQTITAQVWLQRLRWRGGSLKNNQSGVRQRRPTQR